MKKIYTSIIAALCVFGASAQPLTVQTGNIVVPEKMTFTKKINKGLEVSNEPKLSTMATKAESYVGEYQWNYTSLFSGPEVGTLTVTAGSETNQLVFNFTSASRLPFTVTGTFNKYTSTVSIPDQALGFQLGNSSTGATIDAYFKSTAIGEVDNGQGGKKEWFVAATSPVSVSYDESTQSLTFTQIMFVGSEDLSAAADGFGNCTATLPIEWTDLGTGTFFDGILGPWFGVKQDEMAEVEVKVYENPDAPGNYRVETPWAQYGVTCDLELDATDHEYVMVPYTNTGYEHSQNGITYIVGAAYAFANMISPSLGKEAFIAKYPEMNITMDTDAKKIYFPGNCCLVRWPEGSQPSSIFTTNDPYAGYLVLPGGDPAAIDGVIVDNDENAPVEYFNLQGVRVDNPAAGQVVIRRQGAKVSKVFVK